MRQKSIESYSLDLALPNKYLQVTIQRLEPKILNEKVEGLFNLIKMSNKTSTFSLNILGSENSMVTCKYLFCRNKSRL